MARRAAGYPVPVKTPVPWRPPRPTPPQQAQVQSVEQAVRLFHTRKFSEAREHFGKATGEPNREMAHNAELHIRMCDRRLEKAVVDLKTAEERYNYGVAMINARNLGEAQQHLEAALKLEPQADHI